MKIDGFKSEAPAQGYPMLPAGCYVAGIKNAKIDGQEPDQQIVLRLEIIEGDWAGYYTKRYEHDGTSGGVKLQFPPKYKGDFRIQIPNQANTRRQHPEWDLRTLNNSIWCIESSNPGFRWDGDTDHIGQLIGKTVGINVREETYNGNLFTRIGRLENADNVRQGIAKPMKPRAEKPAPAADPSGFTPVETELPF